MQRNLLSDISEGLREAASLTYGCGGVTESTDQHSWFVVGTSFLGLPNEARKPNTTPTWNDIWLNLIGWRQHTSEAQKIQNQLISVFVVPIKLLMMPIRIAVNIVKAITEFLPRALGKIFISISAAASRAEAKATSFLTKGLWFGAKVISGLIAGACLFASFLTCAITSPVKNFRDAQKDFGGIAAAISFTASAIGWMVILPLGLSFAAIAIAPYVPAWLMNVGMFLADKIGNPAFGPFSQAIIDALSLPAGMASVFPTAFAIGALATLTAVYHLYSVFVATKLSQMQDKKAEDTMAPLKAEVKATREEVKDLRKEYSVTAKLIEKLGGFRERVKASLQEHKSTPTASGASTGSKRRHRKQPPLPPATNDVAGTTSPAMRQ